MLQAWNCRSTTAATEGALALQSLLMGQEPFLSCPSSERPVFCPGTGALRPNSFLLSLIKTAHGDFSLNSAELKHVRGGIQARWNPDSLTKFKTTRATSIQCTKEKCKLNRSHSEFWLFCPFLFQLYDTKNIFYIIQGKIFNSVKLSVYKVCKKRVALNFPVIENWWAAFPWKPDNRLTDMKYSAWPQR